LSSGCRVGCTTAFVFILFPSLSLPIGASAADTVVGRSDQVLPLQGQEAPQEKLSEPESHAASAPQVVAVRLAGSLRMDGLPDEEAWAAAPPVTEYWQTQPFEGEPLSLPTDARFLYDDEALYVGAMLYSDGPVAARLKRRDSSFSDTDLFAVFIDGYHDHQLAYRFVVNAAGVRKDSRANPDGSNGDTSWDPVWEATTQISNEGWSVEMRIPFSQLRFSPGDVQVWGIQVERRDRWTNEWAYSAFTPLLERGGVARYGHLVGIEGIEPARPLELLPYITARAERLHVPANTGTGFADPFRSGSDYFGSAGLDLKYRLGTNLTLDAAVNPDFGQVEVDPAVINLTGFETRYQERRPFFVEGQDLFTFQEGGPAGSTGRAPELVYSRRIGRPPHGTLPSEAVFTDAPAAATILGAAKLTVRTDSGWSLGLLEAVTEREATRWVDAVGAPSETIVGPATNYLVGRLRRDLRAGDFRIGAIGTAVNRRLEGSLVGLASAAYTGGLDFTNEWANRSWRFSGAFAGSHLRGSEEVMIATQRSSSRYFQRPDADHLSVDTTASSLSGYYAMADLTKQAGRVQVRLAGAAISPGYEVNDLGFQSRADRFILDTQLKYQETVPGRVFRRWEVRGGPDAIWNYGGDRVFAQFNVLTSWILTNYWSGGTQMRYHARTDDDRLTRGGPLAVGPEKISARINVQTDRTKPYVVTASYDWNRDNAGSRRKAGNINLRVAVQSNWEVSFGPSISKERVAAHYVTAVSDPLATETFGSRYIFADLTQTTFSLDTRLNITFTPNFSFELYAQPFVSTGDYGTLKEFRAPRTFDFLRYGTDIGILADPGDGTYLIDPDAAGPAAAFTVDNRNFTYRSLLGNAVLRWEWRPGSTLYLVWQQSRIQDLEASDPTLSRIGESRIGHDTAEIFRIRPDNIFQLKVSYWFNP
jgi:hypothetical protein